MAIAITASKTRFRAGEPGPPTLEVTGSSGNVRWESSVGACLPSDETETALSVPNLVSHYTDAGDPVVVTVTDLDTDETATVSIDFFATFGQQAGYGFEAEVDEDAEISRAEDESEVIFEGPMFGTWPLAFNNRDTAEYLEALRFRAAHGKRKLFYYEDRGLGSSIKLSPLTSGGVSFSFVFRCNNWSPPEAEGLLSEELPLYGVTLPG
jgi:hypothetical protein